MIVLLDVVGDSPRLLFDSIDSKLVLVFCFFSCVNNYIVHLGKNYYLNVIVLPYALEYG